MSKPEEEMPRIRSWADFWSNWVSSAFVSSYLEVLRPARLLPENPLHLELLLKAFLLEKAVYEIGYELNRRPACVAVPLAGVQQLVGQA
ncbi:MAG: hypothetical protein HYX90_07575 [Chloroflexi bacterium]|nr:hypothetical protein [Chloroflexota bacterium]